MMGPRPTVNEKKCREPAKNVTSVFFEVVDETGSWLLLGVPSPRTQTQNGRERARRCRLNQIYWNS